MPRAQLGEWDSLHAELSRPGPAAAFRRLRDFYASSVERHEVQHRIDFARGLFPVPEILCKQLGVDDPLDAPEGTLRARAREELSAYLASVIAQALTRQCSSWSSCPGMSSSAAAVPTGTPPWPPSGGSRAELGLDSDALVGQGVIRPGRFAQLWTAILAKPPDELRGAAQRFYDKAFGTALASVEVVSRTDHREWRH